MKPMLIIHSNRFLLTAALAFAPLGAEATYHWETRCSNTYEVCAAPKQVCWQVLVADSQINILQGSIEDNYQVFATKNSGPVGLSVRLSYSSRNAQTEFLAAEDTSLGFGWAHTYGAFLFRQQGEIYRRDDLGQIFKYHRLPGTSPAQYKASDGFFETMVENPDGTFTITYPDGGVESFRAFAACPYFFKSPLYQLTQRVDRNANRTVLNHDPAGRLSTVTDAYGRTISFAYDANNRLRTITDPLGRITTLDYSPFGASLAQITDPAGQMVSYAYDAQYRVVRKTHKDGHVSLYTYGNGSLSAEYVNATGARIFLGSVTNSNNWALDNSLLAQQLETAYLPSSVTLLDARSNRTFFAYDKNAYPTSIIPPGQTTGRTFSFDPVTRRTLTETNANGDTTSYGYDQNGNGIAETNCLGQVTRYTYETKFNRVTSITDPNGFVTTNLYDMHGNLIQETDPLGYTRMWTYDPHGNVLSEKDKNGNWTTHTYDSFGNRTNTTDALGYRTSSKYDGVGNLLARTDANLHVSVYAYDALNRLIAETNGLTGPLLAPRLAPGTVNLLIERLPDGTIQLRWNGAGWTLTYATNLAGPFAPVVSGGQEVMASPYLLPAAELEGPAVFYRLQAPGVRAFGSDQGSGGLLQGSAQYTYDAEGHRSSVTDANGHTTWYGYDERGRLTSTTNALGGVTSNTYDAAGNRISETDANGHTTWYAYDVQNRLAFITNALGCVTAYAYDPVGNKIAETHANGHTTAYAYDCLNRRIATTNDPSGLGYVTQFEYDAGPGGGGCGCGSATVGTSHIVKQTDANGKVTYFKYDALGRLLFTIRKQGDTADLIDADDAVTARTYDPNGNRLTTATRISATEYLTNGFGYDALNRPIASTNGAGDFTLTTYDPVGNVRVVQAPNLNLTTNTYDALDRLIQVDDRIGRVASYTYDAVGNRLTATDGNGNTIANHYDWLNRMITVTDAMGSTSNNSYDPVGNLLQATDRMTNSTRYSYDPLNRRTATVDAIGCVTGYRYDCVDNLLAITDANNHTTIYEYDALNRKVKEIYPDLPGPAEPPDSNKRFFTYDPVGNLTGRLDQKSNFTGYAYSDLYFLTNRSYVSDPADRFTFDLAGRMLTAAKTNWLTTNDWVVTFAYDGANRVTNTTQGGRVIAYRFDIPDHTRKITYPTGTNETKMVVTEGNDFRGRLLTVNDGGTTSIAAYSYDLGNRVLTRIYRNGAVAEYVYNPNDWIVSLLHTNPTAGALVAGFTYDYDREGNKRYEENLWNTNRSEAYAYDPIYRLTNWQAVRLVGGTMSAPTDAQQWQLDCLGNWITTASNGIPEFRTHSRANEITSSQTGSGPIRPIYHDYNGNLTNDGYFTYAYDGQNRLVRATRLFLIPGDTGPRPVGQYAYDGLGRRIAKITDPDPGAVAVTTVYTYDSAQIIEEQEPSGTALATYSYGGYIDEVLNMNRSGRSYYYHPNALWSVASLTDPDGNVTERYVYFAYGVVTVHGAQGASILQNAWRTPHSAVGNGVLFTGCQLDEETGLSFHRARYNSLLLGRFGQRDASGYGDGMNLYQYAGGNPTGQLDASGDRKLRPLAPGKPIPVPVLVPVFVPVTPSCFRLGCPVQGRIVMPGKQGGFVTPQGIMPIGPGGAILPGGILMPGTHGAFVTPNGFIPLGPDGAVLPGGIINPGDKGGFVTPHGFIPIGPGGAILPSGIINPGDNGGILLPQGAVTIGPTGAILREDSVCTLPYGAILTPDGHVRLVGFKFVSVP